MSQRVTSPQKGGYLRIRSSVNSIGKKVQRRFRPNVLPPEREQFPANLSHSRGAFGRALHGRQNITLALQPINDARQVAPQRYSEILLQTAPGFRRSQVINLETRNRKRLRSNPFAEWELRLGEFRVFYNVQEQELLVKIEAIGLKVGSSLYVRGERRQL